MFAPRYGDEVVDVGFAGLLIAARDLLTRVESFAGADVRLELAVDVEDGHGVVRDLATLTPLKVASAATWRAGWRRAPVGPHP